MSSFNLSAVSYEPGTEEWLNEVLNLAEWRFQAGERLFIDKILEKCEGLRILQTSHVSRSLAVSSAPTGAWERFVKELLALEIYYRHKAGEQCVEDEYLARYPQYHSLVRHVFRAPDLPRTLGGYELQQIVGRGGMGVVYKAHQKSLRRDVAVKVIRAGLLADDEASERFVREAEAAGGLQHPNIVPIYEVGTAEGVRFYSMPYMSSGSLADAYAGRPVEPDLAARYTHAIALAMAYAHQRGIVHRDLKPANILLDGLGQPLVADFGLARDLADTRDLTQCGKALGTAAYMPPEQAMGRQVGRAGDVYSIGAILYELLTGRPPFKASTSAGTAEAICTRPLTLPSTFVPELRRGRNRDLETICVKCLERKTRRRYSSAEALAEDLESYLTGRPIGAIRVTCLGRLWRRCEDHPRVARAAVVAACSALFVLSLALVVTVSSLSREGHERQRAERNAEIALTRQLASLSRAEFEEFPQRSTLLATAAMQRSLNHGLPMPSEAEEVVRRAIASSGSINFPLPEGGVDEAMFSADARWLLAVSGARVYVWDVTEDNPSAQPLRARDFDDNIRKIATSPDGNWLVAVTERESVFVVSLDPTALLSTRKLLKGNGAVESQDAKIADVVANNRYIAIGADRGVFLYELPVGRDGDRFWAMPGEATEVQSLAFSSDSRWLAAGCAGAAPDSSGTIQLWDLRQEDPGKMHMILPHPNPGAPVVKLSPGGRWLVATSESSNVKLPIPSVFPGSSSILRPARVVRLLDFSAENPFESIGDCGGWKAVVSHDDRWLAAVNDAGVRELWYIGDGLDSAELLDTQHAVRATPAFSHRVDYMVSLGSALDIWSLDHIRRISTSAAQVDQRDPLYEAGEFRAVAISPDDKWIAVKCRHTVEIWDFAHAANGQRFIPLGPGAPAVDNPEVEPLVLYGHDGIIKDAQFSSDSRWLVTTGTDRTLRLWRMQPRRLAYDTTSPGRGDGRYCHEQWLSVNRRFLATLHNWEGTSEQGRDSHLVCLWDTELADPIEAPVATISIEAEEGDITAVAANDDGTLLAAASFLGSFRMFQVGRDGAVKVTSPPELEGGAYYQVAFIPGNSTFVTLELDDSGGGLRLWTLGDGCQVTKSLLLAEGFDYSARVCVSEDGRWIALSDDQHVRLWRLSGGRPGKAIRLNRDGRKFTQAVFSRDSSAIAIADALGRVQCWSLNAMLPNLAFSVDLQRSEEVVSCLAISSSGGTLAIGTDSGSVRIWRVGRHDEPLIMTPHYGGVRRIVLINEADRMLTADDERAYLWDLLGDDPESTRVVLPGYRRYDGADVSMSGRWIVESGGLTRLRPDDLIAEGKRVAGRDLTAAERRRFLGEHSAVPSTTILSKPSN